MRLFLLLLIVFSNLFCASGQNNSAALVRNLPSYNPTVPNPQNNLLNSSQIIDRRNQQIIEQDIRDYESQRAQKEQARNDIDKEFGKAILYKFRSHLTDRGAGFYQMAYDTLSSMLNNQKALSYKKASFITEWAFFEGSLDYLTFNNAVKGAAQIVTLKIQQDKLPINNLAKNYAIYKFFSDTVKVRMPNTERKIVTHYPIRYDFEDFYGEKDWTKGMVSKLLQQQTGQCHSMPLLYLILTEEIGATAYLANSPEHSYIKIPMQNGKYQNVELTNGYLSTDSYVLSSGYIKSEAIANRIYMRPLSKKETIAQCMIDLAKGYRNKYGHDEFYLSMVHTALSHQPNNVNGIYMIANYYYWLYQHVKEQDQNIAYTPAVKLSPELQDIINNFNFYNSKLRELGYEEMPKEAYALWLKSIEKERGLSQKMVSAIQESLWYNKK